MTMRLTKQFLFGAMATLILGGCSSDTLVQDISTRPGQSEDNGEGVYMSVNIKMPTSGTSRSFTDGDNSSNSGVEEGQNYENTVNTVYVVIAKPDNTFITYGEIPARNISVDNPSDPVLYKTSAKFSKNDIEDYYLGLAPNETDRDVRIFVFCNPTAGIREALEAANEIEGDKKNWINAIGTVDVTNDATEIIWSENNFLMSNSAIATRTFPQSIEDWDAFTSENNPFLLSGANKTINIDNSSENERGPVRVERTAARFDFKDGSPKFGGETNTYPVVYQITTNEEGKEVDGDCYVTIKLNKMSLVNMNKQFYYLRRVTEAPENTLTNTILCGAELPWFSNANGTYLENNKGNYVVSPNAQAMIDIIDGNFSNYYDYPLFNNNKAIDNLTIEGWYTSVIDDVLKDNATSDNYGKNEYKIWRYLTENSIPNTGAQKNGQTTGIVFKGKMVATEDALNSKDDNVQQLAKTINNVGGVLKGENTDPIIYKFTGVKNNSGGMYATWPNVEDAAKKAAIVPVWEASNDPEYQDQGGGYWRLEINRSNSLFRAVFGDGTCGKYTFKDSSGKEWEVPDPVQTVDKNSPSYLWDVWMQAGYPGSDSETTINMKKAMTEAGFTLYQTSEDGTDGIGYYCYYYYWNRHNDNGRNGIMGPMEFCVVRNNVYKIAVTNIKSIGHPRITENDPNPPTPDTDDEIDDVYLTVQVEVLPWVVRVNDVEF